MPRDLGSSILGLALLAFIGVASAVLLWDGLAAGVVGHQALRRAWRARAEVVVGVIGFAAALWVALGLLSHAH
jgi:hypothetical protein